MTPKRISDGLWERIKSLSPKKKFPTKKGGRPRIDDCLVLGSGIVWRFINGHQFGCSRSTWQTRPPEEASEKAIRCIVPMIARADPSDASIHLPFSWSLASLGHHRNLLFVSFVYFVVPPKHNPEKHDNHEIHEMNERVGGSIKRARRPFHSGSCESTRMMVEEPRDCLCQQDDLPRPNGMRSVRPT